jgi:hypothetical protein
LLAHPSHQIAKHRLAVPLYCYGPANASQVTGRPWPISSIAEPVQPCDSDTSSTPFFVIHFLIQAFINAAVITQVSVLR